MQLRQFKDPVDDWYKPAPQFEQPIAAAAAEYLPGTQLAQLNHVVAPEVSRNVPAAQLTHAADPVLGW